MSRGRVYYGIGVFLGTLFLSWVFFLLSLLRRARFFHPTGVVYSAKALPAPSLDSVEGVKVAERLAGCALVRFSGGLFKQTGRRDSLGLGVRFHCKPGPCATNAPGGQDLALVTFRSFPRMTQDIRATHHHDYLANTYWAVVPYEVEELGRVRLRITASGEGGAGTRDERLDAAVSAGEARLRLEMAPWLTEDYQPLVELHLGSRVALEDELRLSSGSPASGLRPIGFLQGLRVAPYRASHLARRLHRRVSRPGNPPGTRHTLPDDEPAFPSRDERQEEAVG